MIPNRGRGMETIDAIETSFYETLNSLLGEAEFDRYVANTSSSARLRSVISRRTSENPDNRPCGS